jgi:alanyl-tRNA synthetase
MGDFLRDADGAVAAVLASVTGDKLTFLAVCGKEAILRGVRAGDLIKTVTAAAGGSGGGRPDSAMGGGRDPGKLKEALDAALDFVKANVKEA